MVWVPPRTRGRDAVCFFPDCRVPFVLKQTLAFDAFQWVGDAHLQGVDARRGAESTEEVGSVGISLTALGSKKTLIWPLNMLLHVVLKTQPAATP